MQTYIATNEQVKHTFKSDCIEGASEWVKNNLDNQKEWHIVPAALITASSDNRLIFERAVAAGFLSLDKNAKNYAGAFMYMGIHNNAAALKHINLRTYLTISLDLLNYL
jgi:hypothetical protein